jgi:hypothetical protein
VSHLNRLMSCSCQVSVAGENQCSLLLAGSLLCVFPLFPKHDEGSLLELLQKAFSIAVVALYSPGPQYLLTKAMG